MSGMMIVALKDDRVVAVLAPQRKTSSDIFTQSFAL